MQFDETSPELSHAPEHGQDTEAVLMEMGIEWDDIERYKAEGAIL